MISAVPVAVLTNAARVTVTGVLTYHYGKQATGGTSHDISGWAVYAGALLMLIGVNAILRRVFAERDGMPPTVGTFGRAFSATPILPLLILLVSGGMGIAWFDHRGEAETARRPLTDLPATLGEWQQKGDDIRFDPRVEDVLRTTDYIMREYSAPDGRVANIYIGYYASQRTGATYHSPQNCLPGAGWVMSDPQQVEIPRSDGGTFTANQYTVENGTFREVMIYWYQGRGRTEASEYVDKLNVIRDSVLRGRSDGALIRVMTSAGGGPDATRAAIDLASRLSADLTPFIPE
jgi:EpsI family protein